MAIGLLRTIEATFNDIWGVTQGRGWFVSIVGYWATISFGPVILVVVIGLILKISYDGLKPVLWGPSP